MREYTIATSEEELLELYNELVQIRKEDVADFNNLANVFIKGRKVAKIPSGSADVAVTDRLGDFNYTPTALYILIDNAGTAEWRTTALSSF